MAGSTNAATRTHLREPLNRYDPNAIQVIIDRQAVGYIAKEDAAEINATLAECEQHNAIIGFTADLCGGTPDKPHIGVFISYDDRHLK